MTGLPGPNAHTASGRLPGLMDGRFFADIRIDFILVLSEWCLRSDLVFQDQCFSIKLNQAAVPPKVPDNAGFLVEWEDRDGEPALTATGPPPPTPFVNSLGMKFLPVPGTDIFLCAHETRKSDFAVFAVDQPGFSNSWQNPQNPLSASKVTWGEARVFAESLGGHLATLSFAEENEWVKTTFGEQIAALGSVR